MDESAAPLYRQIATLVEDSIVEGALKPGQQTPSTTELAAFHEINPATARRGLALLVDAGVVAKRRGVGMFVTPEAREMILARRRADFAAAYVAPLIDEAARLDIDRSRLHDLVERVAESRGLYS